MEAAEYAKMAEVEETYWWYRGRQHIVRNQLKKISRGKDSTRICNVGSGTGATVPFLEKFGRVTNVEVSDHAIEWSKKKGITDIVKVNDVELPFEDGEFDVVVAMDVLEHIEQDLKALKEWNRILKPGGHVLITVPAHQWLWSKHDESLHHFRRYTVSEAHQKFNLAGFQVTKRSYAISFSFPLIVGFRFLSSFVSSDKKTSHVTLPRPINSFFVGLLRLEGKILKYFNMPFGTSVLAVGRKPHE